MAYRVMVTGDRKHPRYKEFLCDDIADIAELSSDPRENAFGSMALVIATGDIYCLNSKREWVKIGG